MTKTILALAAVFALSGVALADGGDDPQYLTTRAAVDFTGTASMTSDASGIVVEMRQGREGRGM